MRFGQIMEIQCKYDNLNDATLIRFTSNQQAFAAFKSPESILNNRFIRIYWLNIYQQHKVQNQQATTQQQQQPENDEPAVKRHVKERLGQIDNNTNTGNSSQDLQKNKENDHKHLNEATNLKDSTDELSESSVVRKEEIILDEKNDRHVVGGKVLKTFDSMTLKQDDKSSKYNEIASIKAIEAENQKVSGNE